MSVELPVVEARLKGELEGLGISSPEIVVTSAGGDAYVVLIVSPSFEGQTFLDREMRVRPAVVRAFSGEGTSRGSYIIEAETPAEREIAAADSPEEPVDNEPEEQRAERLNRQQWREQRESVMRALRSAGYEVEPLGHENLILGTKRYLAEEKILVAFAVNPKVDTVDLKLRQAMHDARSTSRMSASYYLSPEKLVRPFSNQTSASVWMTLETATGFLHRLASSKQLAASIVAHADQQFAYKDRAHRGPVIEPSVLSRDSQTVPSFFHFVEEWSQRKNPSFLLLIAPAGHGKTTLTLQLARMFADKFSVDDVIPKLPVPLFVPFEAVRRTVDFEALVHKTLAVFRGGNHGAFAELLRLNNSILFVDGFDELADDAGTATAQAQIRSMKPMLQGNAKILLAGRTLFTEHFSGGLPPAESIRRLLGDIEVEVLEILPFDADQIEKYVRSREELTNPEMDKVARFASETPDHNAICANPLFLRILCSLVANDKLPSVNQVNAGVDALIDRVCEREEDRQHLGIGPEKQVDFLTEIAADIFRADSKGLPRADVEIAANIYVDEARQAEVVPRLLDHALLAPAPGASYAFIHPFIRDVILGRCIVKRTDSFAKMKDDKFNLLGVRDLPEGTVKHLARTPFPDAGLPRAWLSAPNGITSQTRRNLFRIVLASSAYRSENPRMWLEDAWTKDHALSQLDLSRLVIESRSFDGCTFLSCDLSGAIVDDCSLRSVAIDGCTLELTSFMGCWGDAKTRVVSGEVVDCEVRADRPLGRASDAATLTKFLQGGDAANPRRPSRAAADACRRLLRDTLCLLVTLEPAPQFRTVKRAALERLGKNAGEHHALERAIIPNLVGSVCDIVLSGGSRENVEVAKPWRSAVVQYIRTGRAPTGLDAVVAKIIGRGAKYFE